MSGVTILAFDPGEHIGYCRIRVYPPFEEHPENAKTHAVIRGWGVVCEEIGSVTPDTPREAVDVIMKIMSRSAIEARKATYPPILVVEHYTFSKKSMFKGSRATVEAFGIIKSCAFYLPDFSLDTRQKPASALNLVSLEVLYDLELHKKGDKLTDHALMAGRHAILAISRMRAGELRSTYNEMTMSRIE